VMQWKRLCEIAEFDPDYLSVANPF
jgi:hypothetical protein